jgi:hypothetical protein
VGSRLPCGTSATQLKSIDSTGNRFLDGLPSSALDDLRPFETVQLRSGQNLHEPGGIADYAYFPSRGVISLVAGMNDGTAVEIGMIGREGMRTSDLVDPLAQDDCRCSFRGGQPFHVLAALCPSDLRQRGLGLFKAMRAAFGGQLEHAIRFTHDAPNADFKHPRSDFKFRHGCSAHAVPINAKPANSLANCSVSWLKIKSEGHGSHCTIS